VEQNAILVFRQLVLWTKCNFSI